MGSPIRGRNDEQENPMSPDQTNERIVAALEEIAALLKAEFEARARERAEKIQEKMRNRERGSA